MDKDTPKKVVITDREGKVTETVVSDDDTARHFESLVFEPGGPIVKVTVTDSD
ncbi:hypothetical protein [Streptomyces olivaceus]|uniref:hypothetical protein n=1 Tax=Streptomyces olivaceus TaxID=47716 RepID=UPI00249046C6|nr:hypothetical protein [Streptomyces olivaceus]